ncbi:XRE family transcriptional regulator [Occultella glacieicola]|uniref:XRE family transcriptional regulator n=1 Tax=Occultella glacieicola TaxID=2518684 RepID=A0ABY2DYK4_9MICO|nr:cupin domain-containing protein [Occultella glacieicola]TDE89570.1 XRE family transcriptional regulator [Occultella glacieicola]
MSNGEQRTPTERENLGRRVRTFRKSRGMSIRDLAAATGRSPSYIHQIESGSANAAFAVLRSLADALSIKLIDLFEEPGASGKVLRRRERPSILHGDGVRTFAITPPPLLDVEVTSTEYPPGGIVGGPDYTHGDVREIFIVVRGTFLFTLGESSFELAVGDSLDFRSSVPHQITNVGSEVAEAIWVSSPPASLPAAPNAAEHP